MSKTDQEKIKQAVDLLIDKDTDLTSFFAKDGMLKELTKNLFERALKAEMDEHLGYSKYGRVETENSQRFQICAKRLKVPSIQNKFFDNGRDTVIFN